FGASNTDPVSTVIRNALPNVNTSNADVANAISLYSFLTARVSSVSTSQNVDEKAHQYAKYAPITQRFVFTQGSVFLQDSFRVNPHFTLNYGLRWQLDGDIHSTNGIDTSPRRAVCTDLPRACSLPENSTAIQAPRWSSGTTFTLRITRTSHRI